MDIEAKNQTRIEWVDTAKGIAIVLVVMGHCVSGQTFTWIYSFHVPLFFFISGYLSLKSIDLDCKQYVLKKIRRILWPYLIFWIICVSCNFFFAAIRGEPYIWYPQRLITFLLAKRNGIWDSVALWFLPALFCCEIYFFLIRKIIKSDIMLGLLVLVVGMMSCIHFNSIASTNVLPLSFDIALFQAIFYFAGYLISKKKVRICLGGVSLTVIIGGFLNGSLFFNDNIWNLFAKAGIPYEFTYVIFAFSGIAFWIAVAKGFKHNRILMLIGQNSIIIMGIHVEFCFALIDLIFSKYNINIVQKDLKGLVMTFLSLLIAIPFIKWINKNASWIVNCPIYFRK